MPLQAFSRESGRRRCCVATALAMPSELAKHRTSPHRQTPTGAFEVEVNVGTSEFERLAERMRRPPRSLQAFAILPPEQLRDLREAVDEACSRQHADLDHALGRAVPGVLRGLVLGLLRGRVSS